MQEGDKWNGTSPREHTIARSVFLIGVPELQAPELAGRYLLLPGPSDYRSLPQRTRAFCQWAISRDDWDYLFKCDDDTYVSIPRLIRYPLTADYIGAEWAPGVRYASGGAGYFLSRKAAEAVARHLTQKEGPEDVYVRDALASQGIPFTKDQRFVALGNEELRPRANNDLITLHAVPTVPADLFYKSHQECTGLEPPTHLDPNPPLSKRLSPEDLRCLKEGQRQLTRMLKYLFEEVCEPHGIRALAFGGTLIGAVNYGGWIPWDADADMLVHRDDFERFKAQIRASCPADCWYQSRETDPHYKANIEKLRYLHAHYDGADRYPWHGGLQVDIIQFWFENGVFMTSAPDHDATIGARLREEDILPSIELPFDGVRLRGFRDPAAYLRVRYATEPLQSERNVPVEKRYPHEGAIRLGASAADRARYPQLYKAQLYKDQSRPGMKITAYPLYGLAAPLEPSPEGRGWDFLCPCAFEAVWHGGPGAGDVEIRLDEDAPGTPSFVQSLEGEGRLTFYPGYQCKTEAEHALWVRGPINAAKDGAVPLESALDTSIFPGTLTMHWRLTRPGQIVRFAAGERFCTILPYPKAEMTVEVMPFDGGMDGYERALESLAESEGLQGVFERLAAGGAV